MLRSIRILPIVLVILVVSSVPAYAQPPTPTPLGGGAAINPHPRPLSAIELQAVALKRAAFQSSLDYILSSRASKRTGNPMVSAASGSVWTDIFEEPQYPSPWYTESGNWCGPGSTSAVVSNWNATPENFTNSTYGNGGVGYLTWLAKQGVSGIGPMVVTNPNTGRPVTWDTTERDTLNHETNSLFYVIQNPVNGLTNFVAYVNSDLNGFDQLHHPLVTVVQTSGLPGWGTWNAAHYQWVVAFDDSINYIEFGDSAGPNSNSFGNPFGWHTSVTLSDYYGHISSLYDEIVW